MNENTRVHYQTSFRVKRISEDIRHSPYTILQNIVYKWLKNTRKERDHRLRTEKKAFFEKCDWKNLFNTFGSIATNRFYSNECRCWALRYVHLDGEFGTKRYWYVDIGIRENRDVEEAIFYCKISYARDFRDLSVDELPTPRSNTPRFIRDILNEKSGLKIYSEEEAFGLFDQPVPFKVKQGQQLAALIESEKRKYALLVFNGNRETLMREATGLSLDLAGKAQVIALDQDSEFAEELKLFLKRDLWIKRGSYRVFFPLNRNKIIPSRHRWFSVDDVDYLDKREALINSLLKNYTLWEEGAVTNISEIGRMISRQNLLEAFKDGSNTENDLNALIEEYTKLEKDKLEVEKERDYFVEECDALENQLNAEKAKNTALDYHSARQNSDIQVNYNSSLEKLPMTLEEIVRLKAKIFKDRILFAEEAYASAAEYDNCKSLDHAWKILYHIGTTLYKMKFLEGQAVDLVKDFQDKTGYEYAKTEGPDSKGNSRIRQSRVIEVDGRKYEIWAHIIYGNEEPKMLRIHFAYDDELKKIIIGYVGPHMENATTRKRS